MRTIGGETDAVFGTVGEKTRKEIKKIELIREWKGKNKFVSRRQILSPFSFNFSSTKQEEMHGYPCLLSSPIDKPL